MKERILAKVYQFFVDSSDFNGIPLRQISDDLEIEYKQSIDLIKELVSEGRISIQSSTNPHIIGRSHYPLDGQLKLLDDAKKTTTSVEAFLGTSFVSEDTEYPICLYPSPNFLKNNRDVNEFGYAEYTKRLALGEPQLRPMFFKIEVLERYLNDPRFAFRFEDYSGSIYSKCDENGNPVLPDDESIFLKTFGLGFDTEGNRLAVVYLRYLNNLTNDHQIYWKSKEITGKCKVLKEYHENTVMGKWTSSYSVFTAFLGELECLNGLAETIFGKTLFLKTYSEEQRPREFSFFFTPTLKNYNDFVLLLDKMISDNINKAFFRGKVEEFHFEILENNLVERKPKGTLRLFEEWLSGIYETDEQEALRDLFIPLRKIRRERQNPAHRVSENEYHPRYFGLQKELIKGAWESIQAFRQIFSRHPSAKAYPIPDWLENAQIKVF